MFYPYIRKITRHTPIWLKSILRKFGIYNVTGFIFDENDIANVFRTEWAEEFSVDILREYWSKFRHLEELRRLCCISENSRVLDVGCGISTVLHLIPGERYGIDPAVDSYKKIYNFPAEFKVDNCAAENIKFPDEYFDVVFCTNVIDHVKDPEKSVAEIYRVLKDNGFFVLTVEIFKIKTRRGFPHPFSFTRENLDSLLEDKFRCTTEWQSPKIGIKAYTEGARTAHSKESIMILRKIKQSVNPTLKTT